MQNPKPFYPLLKNNQNGSPVEKKLELLKSNEILGVEGLLKPEIKNSTDITFAARVKL